VVILILWLTSSSLLSPSNNNTANAIRNTPGLEERQRKFWDALNAALKDTKPNCPEPIKEDNAPIEGFDADKPHERPQKIKMSTVDILRMRDAHWNFVKKIKNSEKLKPAYVPGTRGLVYTAGGPYLPVLVISLRMLRRTGSRLPAEVFLKDKSEYEAYICEEVLPALNARCVVLSEIVNHDPKQDKVEIEHYQLKIFAMLFSSFEEVVWLDADCFPLHKPELLLDSEPYKTSGMVTWPDYWASTIAPEYYLISQMPVPPVTIRATTEAGEILISKATHPYTLLLATYYNFYGPTHYFRLLSQGAPGEGDKDTFIQAATVVGEKFYTTVESVKPLGHASSDGIHGAVRSQTRPSLPNVEKGEE
jgi:alpha 1,2-mannosyltransferase